MNSFFTESPNIESDFTDKVKKFLNKLYAKPTIKKNSDNIDTSFDMIKKSDKLENLKKFLQENLKNYINEWTDPEFTFQNLLDCFIKILLNEKPIDIDEPVFTFDEIHGEFNIEILRLKELFSDSLAKLENPLIVAPNTINEIIKYLANNKINTSWINLPYWKAIYETLSIIERNFEIIQKLREMIILTKILNSRKIKIERMMVK